MQQTAFEEHQERTELDPSDHCPTLAIWSIPQTTPGPGSDVSVIEPKCYPAQDHKVIFTTQEKDSIVVRYIDPHNSEGIFKEKALPENTHDLNSLIGFCPQGILGPCIPITGDSCVYTSGDKSLVFGQDGSIQVLYPSHPTISLLPPLIQSLPSQSRASNRSLQHLYSVQRPPTTNLASDYSANVPLVDTQLANGNSAYHQFLSSHAESGRYINNQTADGSSNPYIDNGVPTYCQSDNDSFVCDNFMNNSTANDWCINGEPANNPPHDFLLNVETGGPELESYILELDIQSLLQLNEPFDWRGGYM